MGAINSAEQLARIRELSQVGEDEGAVRWSPPCVLPERGFWFAPTVFTDVSQTHRIAREEIFGPVAVVVRFKDEQEAVRLANDTEFGLASYVFTEDLAKALRVAGELDFGIVGVNRGLVSTAAAPFGGLKTSGLGREGGLNGLEEYVETQYLSLPVDAPLG